MHLRNVAGPRAFLRRFFPTILCLTIACVCPFALAQGAATRTFDISAQSAESALKLFSDQSGQGTIMNAKTVDGIRTNAIKGDFTPAEALDRMLDGTGLVATHDEKSGSFVVHKQTEAPPKKTSSPARPETVSSQGDKSVDDNDHTIALSKMIVTTATRSPKAVDHLPGAINLVTEQDIAKQLLFTDDTTSILADTVPGYSPSRQSLSVAGESLRGRLALYELDGIPQSTPLREGAREGSGFADLAIIDRIEVINGPSATEGLGASGGIINFITKSAKEDGTHIQVDAKIDSQFESHNLGWRVGVTAAHKEVSFDLFVAAVEVDRPLDYDANGRAIGFDANGSAQDSTSHNLFIKIGKNFGAADKQRIQFSLNRFDLKGNGNYMEVDGNSAIGVTSTAARGVPVGKPTSNVMQAANIEYTNSDLAGGVLTLQLYEDREAIRFTAGIDGAKQDPLFAPIGALVDQSEIDARKYGARSVWIRPNLFVDGLELSAGVDYLRDKTLQDLALTNRTWVPPLKYTSVAPFVQLEYERGPLTIRGGVRDENARLNVDTFTTLYTSNRTLVRGGSESYTKAIKNIGAVLRLPLGWSVYLAHSEGFSIPDAGVVLRGISTPNQSVSQLLDLKPIIVTNHEVGFTWHGKQGSFGASYYDSYSSLAGNFILNPMTGDFEVNRVPVDIKGIEFTGEIKITKTLVLDALYSHIHGKTAAAPGLPIDVDLGSGSQSPDKLVGTLNWSFSNEGTVRFAGTNLFSRDINIGRPGLEEHFKGYALFNLSIQYRTKYGVWALGSENLFNKYYLPPINSSVLQNWNPAFYFAGRGRVVSLSDTIKF